MKNQWEFVDFMIEKQTNLNQQKDVEYNQGWTQYTIISSAPKSLVRKNTRIQRFFDGKITAHDIQSKQRHIVGYTY